MNNDYIAVFDSGIGGLNVLYALVKTFPFERFIYFGDNSNAPYGNRTNGDLLNLATKNIFNVLGYKIKLIVIACNTLSVNVLDKLKEIFAPIKVIGVFPPIEKQIVLNEKTLLLATNRTAENYKYVKNIKAVGLSSLVLDIEKNVFDIDKVDLSFLLPLLKEKFDTVILGCTHFIYVKERIKKFLTTEKVVCGVDNSVKVVKKIVKSQKSLGKSYLNPVLFLGKDSEFNRKVWENFDFKVNIF